jgi:hypothetical protein
MGITPMLLGPQEIWTLWEVENLLSVKGIELRFLCRPAQQQSLYRLSYLGFRILGRFTKICRYIPTFVESARQQHALYRDIHIVTCISD